MIRYAHNVAFSSRSELLLANWVTDETTIAGYKTSRLIDVHICRKGFTQKMLNLLFLLLNVNFFQAEGPLCT